MGVPGSAVQRLQDAAESLRSKGYLVTLGEHATRPGLVSAPADERARELSGAFAGPARAILPPWGGELAIELIDRLDWQTMAATPPWFVGWSDISTLLMPLTITTGVATLHGANLMDEPWELPVEFHRWTDVASLGEGASFTQSMAPRRRSRPWSTWEEEPLDRDSAYAEATRWESLDGQDPVRFRGRLIGGCLETVSLLAGSPFGDVPSFARRHAPEGVIVYLEVSDGDAITAARLLRSLRLAGWFEHATGILMGRTDAPDSPELTQREAVERALGDLGIPVIVNFDTGHQSPQMPLVNGALAEVELSGGVGRITQHLVA